MIELFQEETLAKLRDTQPVLLPWIVGFAALLSAHEEGADLEYSVSLRWKNPDWRDSNSGDEDASLELVSGREEARLSLSVSAPVVLFGMELEVAQNEAVEISFGALFDALNSALENFSGSGLIVDGVLWKVMGCSHYPLKLKSKKD